LIPRYTREQMGAIWRDANKYAKWLEVELADERTRPVPEVAPLERPAVVILGSGPNRIGQGVEFDYCCVHAAFALSDAGYETVMLNCNPETVSTDYDTSDRLFFEPLFAEEPDPLADLSGGNAEVIGHLVLGHPVVQPEEGGQALIDVDLVAENQRSEITAKGSATVALPRGTK